MMDRRAPVEFDPGSVDVWVFDLDNTLYPPDCNLFPQVHARMGEYIVDRFGLDPVAAKAMQKDYFLRHGTTLAGLMAEKGIDPHDYLTFVHDIDLSIVPADPRLDPALAALPGRKLIYTNGSVGHSDKVTRHLGIDRHFEACFDIVAAAFLPKPDDTAFDAFLARYDVDPTRAVMVEDMAKNLVPARARGMTTVWLRSDTSVSGADGPLDHVDHTIDDLPAWLEGLSR